MPPVDPAGDHQRTCPRPTRQVIDKFRTVKMVDVVMPTTDGRIVTLPHYVEPKQDLVILLDRLGLTLPAQPPPKISSEAAESAKTTV